MNETKRDIFEEMKWELISNLANTIDQNGGLRPLEDATKVGENYVTRYATALPDDLPVIPKSVSDLLVAQKQHYMPLSNVLGPVHELGVMRQQSGNPSLNWVASHENEFARAWVLEVWKVKETEEVVKL